MKSEIRRPLSVEALEDRWVPATIQFDGSNLSVSNLFLDGGASKIQVLQQANDSFEVLDGNNNNGSYDVTGNITILGNNAKDTVIVNVNNTVGLLGNLSIDAGNANGNITIDGNQAGAFIAGNSNISLGSNASQVTLGGTTGFTNKGSLTVTARGNGDNSITIGGAANSTIVLGNTQIIGFPVVTLGGTQGDLFAGNVGIGNFQDQNASAIQLKAGAQIRGNFTEQASNAPTSVQVNGSVLGFATVALGNGTNSVTLAGGGAPVTLGNLTITGGNGNTTFTPSGGSAVTVLNNVSVNWGNGNNVVGSSAGFTVNGSLSVVNGNGSLNAATDAFQGQDFGNLSVNSGNGNNQVTLDGTNGAVVGGVFNYNGGNGGNSVTIDNASPNVVDLNGHVGNDPANLLTIGAGTTPGTITGTFIWNDPTAAIPGVNGLVNNGYVFTSPITLINIPS
jgi:hypothetical protein